MARPKTGKYDIDKMIEIINDYVDDCIRKKRVPILKEVTVKAGWNYHWVMMLQNKEENKELRETIERLLDCKEWLLERLGHEGKIEKTMAVFSLKQLGWSDSQAVEVNSGETGLKIKLVKAE